ncbi:MAG: rhodanese-like domain-containing protein [Candidatus Latescibacterota bacterium]
MKKKLLFALVAGIFMTASASSGGLVDADWLAERLSETTIRIVDIRDNIKDYWQGHIPGAVYLSVDALRGSEGGVPPKLIPSESLAMLLGEMGIEENTMVVVYSGKEGYNAPYLVWALDVLGHPSSMILDGGFDRWQAEARPVTQDYPQIEPRVYRSEKERNDSVRADLGDVKKIVDQGGGILVDVRPHPLHTGEEGPWKRKGHIQGALSHFWGDDLEDEGTWKDKETLRKSYEQIGATAEKTIIVYCGQGQMSAHAYFTLTHILGYPRVKNYDGGFGEWSNLEELPVETGVFQDPAVSLSFDADRLLRERCLSCHKLTRVYKARKNRTGWEKTIAGMVKKGARLDDAEREAVVQLLSETQGKE